MGLAYERIFDTKQATQEQWLVKRREGIGGSDMAAVLGYSPWKCAIDVWLDKTSALAPDEGGNRFTHWGHKMEQLVAEEFTEQTGMKVRKNHFMLRSREHPYLLANVDREIVGAEEGLECKNASAYKRSEWEGDEVPAAYYVQCQHYMAVTGAPGWYIAAVVGGNDFIYKRIPRDEKAIALIIEEGARFWEQVQRRTRPDPDGSAAAKEALRSLYPASREETKVLDDYAMGFIEEYTQAARAEKEAKERKQSAQNHLCAMLGDCEKGTYGLWTVSWKSAKPRETFDAKAFKADHPDMAASYIRIGAATRRFSIT